MSAHETLRRILRFDQIDPEERRRRNMEIAGQLQEISPFISTPQFDTFHQDDVGVLFEKYDEQYFAGTLQKSLPVDQISFRLSRRMTRAAGKTTRTQRRDLAVPPKYEIAISATLMFQSFQDDDRAMVVTGHECQNRLEALMRVMEHELIHLCEFLVWTDSNCAVHRFQGIANRLFGHTDHRHELMTPREAARKIGVFPGQTVRFEYEGRQLVGRVNRVTKRATVLVLDPAGQRFSDGRYYSKFYVPVESLRPVVE